MVSTILQLQLNSSKRPREVQQPKPASDIIMDGRFGASRRVELGPFLFCFSTPQRWGDLTPGGSTGLLPIPPVSGRAKRNSQTHPLVGRAGGKGKEQRPRSARSLEQKWQRCDRLPFGLTALAPTKLCWATCGDIDETAAKNTKRCSDTEK